MCKHSLMPSTLDTLNPLPGVLSLIVGTAHARARLGLYTNHSLHGCTFQLPVPAHLPLAIALTVHSQPLCCVDLAKHKTNTRTLAHAHTCTRTHVHTCTRGAHTHCVHVCVCDIVTNHLSPTQKKRMQIGTYESVVETLG